MSGAYLKRGDVAVSHDGVVYVWHRFNVLEATGLGIDDDAMYIEGGVFIVLDVINRGESTKIARVITPTGRIGNILVAAIRVI